MDPMTYRETYSEHGGKEENLNRSDIDILSCALSLYFRSGKPGIASLFVYKVGKNNGDVQSQFWKFVEDLKEQVADNITASVELSSSYFSLLHNGGNRNVAGLIHSPQIDLSSRLKSACIDPGIASGRKFARPHVSGTDSLA
ncbi:MAG: hypothetical protein OXS28_02355 [Gammaproteobacteria bacterium]|nr:hypothetical protein [Gammaproteobacteria bacterium]